MADNYESPHAGTGPKNESVSPTPVLQIVVGLFMIIALMVTAVIVGRLEAREAVPATAPAAAAAPATAPETPAVPAPGDALAAEVKEIKSRLDGLSTQVKGIQGMVDGLHRPEPAPDIKPIQAKVVDLAISVAVILPLSDKVSRIDDHVGDVGKQIEGLGAEVVALKKVIGTIAAATTPKPDDGPTVSADVNGSDLAMGEAIDLFKKGRYKDALDRFRKLTEADDKDARSWYYAALASGLVTRNWNGGDAVAFVKKGVEREKAGSPAPDKIDAVFSDLNAQTGKDWLTFYRKSAR